MCLASKSSSPSQYGAISEMRPVGGRCIVTHTTKPSKLWEKHTPFGRWPYTSRQRPRAGHRGSWCCCRTPAQSRCRRRLAARRRGWPPWRSRALWPTWTCKSTCSIMTVPHSAGNCGKQWDFASATSSRWLWCRSMEEHMGCMDSCHPELLFHVNYVS